MTSEGSLRGYRWRLREGEGSAAACEEEARERGTSVLLGRMLWGRGVRAEDWEGFLHPRLRDLLPEPNETAGMAEAVERAARAVMEGELVGLFGDYDADGLSAAALLGRYLGGVGAQLSGIYAPERSEGFGPSAGAMKEMGGWGSKLVFTLDCGTSSHDALEEARRLGMDVVVLDHHPHAKGVVEGIHVVNPALVVGGAGGGGGGSVGKGGGGAEILSGSGVTFLFVVGLNRELRKRGWFSDGREEPDVRLLTQFAALGTVCDVVPLRGVNRALTATGLRVLGGDGCCEGLRGLMERGGLRGRLGAESLGFVLGPRLNAAGRMGRTRAALEVLMEDDSRRAEEMCGVLEEMNLSRREVQREAEKEAIADAEARGVGSFAMAVLDDEGKSGVAGILASRLAERYGVPALVGVKGAGVVRGSGRSVSGVDLGDLLREAEEGGLVLRGGGHAMAVGFELAEGGEEGLRSFLEGRLGAGVGLDEDGDALDEEETLWLDAESSAGGLKGDELEGLVSAEPFGKGNPAPLIAVRGALLERVEWISGGAHVRVLLRDADGGERLRCIAFGAGGSELEGLDDLEGGLTDVVLQASRDGRRGGVKLEVRDARRFTG